MRIEARADVLIIGGGMAAAWAAISAARAGASVVLVDKGYVGTSGVTATGGPNHWWVPPDPGKRETAIEARYARSQDLADRDWMARIIETTWHYLPQLAPYYPFGSDGQGGTFYSGVRGPEYMRALRRYATDVGVRILDHYPALELLIDANGAVVGASGYARLVRQEWTIRAGAVVMATGGCAFRSGLIGSYGNTGDGYLMAAEAGAELSGMEFSTAYSLSPAWNSTRTLPYPSARFFDAEGSELHIPPPMSDGPHLRALAASMLAGPVFADLVDAPPLLKLLLRRIQPASPTPFERKGVRIFEDRFEVKLFGEGTIRGTGGLRVVDNACRTTVSGLFAAGDAASRELVAGATSGGGAQNSAWALTSGVISGQAAAAEAVRQRGLSDIAARPVGAVGLRPKGSPKPIATHDIVAEIQAHSIAYDKALWRSESSLSTSQVYLHRIWSEIADHGFAKGLELVGLRELTAMTATARWITAAALARRESRGLHMRVDAPHAVGSGKRLLVGGLDTVWTHFEPSKSVPTPLEVTA